MTNKIRRVVSRAMTMTKRIKRAVDIKTEQ